MSLSVGRGLNSTSPFGDIPEPQVLEQQGDTVLVGPRMSLQNSPSATHERAVRVCTRGGPGSGCLARAAASASWGLSCRHRMRCPAFVQCVVVRRTQLASLWRITVNSAKSLKDLAALPGNLLDALQGDRASQPSIRINEHWRICFR